MTMTTMNMNFLMEFRQLWLRVIALSWADDTFKQSLVGQSAEGVGKALTDNFSESDSELIEGLTKAFSLKFVEGQAHFDDAAKEWYGGVKVDEIIIPLPLTPHILIYDSDQKYHKVPDKSADCKEAQALADYYPRHSGGLVGAAAPGFSAIASHPDLGSTKPFLELGGYLIDAMALAWEDPRFKAQLIAPGNSEAALANRLNFKNPWYIKITITDMSDPEVSVNTPVWVDKFPISTKDSGTPGPVGKWVTVPSFDPKQSSFDIETVHGWKINDFVKVGLTLQLPELAGSHVSRPVALAAYNQTGPEYPFSCPG